TASPPCYKHLMQKALRIVVRVCLPRQGRPMCLLLHRSIGPSRLLSLTSLERHLVGAEDRCVIEDDIAQLGNGLTTPQESEITVDEQPIFSGCLSRGSFDSVFQ